MQVYIVQELDCEYDDEYHDISDSGYPVGVFAKIEEANAEREKLEVIKFRQFGGLSDFYTGGFNKGLVQGFKDSVAEKFGEVFAKDLFTDEDQEEIDLYDLAWNSIPDEMVREYQTLVGVHFYEVKAIEMKVG